MGEKRHLPSRRIPNNLHVRICPQGGVNCDFLPRRTNGGEVGREGVTDKHSLSQVNKVIHSDIYLGHTYPW